MTLRLPTPLDIQPPLGRRLLGAVLGLALVLGGCTTTQPHRYLALDNNQPAIACEDEGQSAAKEQQTKVSEPCLRTMSQTGRDPAQPYTLHFAEFDDQGWVFDDDDTRPEQRAESQIGNAMAQITRMLADGHAVQLFVFVHGWRHSAAPDDQNLNDFRGFLAERSRDLRPLNDGRKPRVVGIYVGWRGSPVVDLPGLVHLTFWERKGAAERIAQGSIRELFARLRSLSLRTSGAMTGRESRRQAPLRTWVIGHSFGASIVYRSVAQSLIGNFADDLDAGNSLIPSYFDSIILVNPAIEAARYTPLVRIARERVKRCEAKLRAADPAADAAACQQPAYMPAAMMVFTSAGDTATRDWFPFGATLGNLFQFGSNPIESQANQQTIGWLEDYRTHDLAVDSSGCTPGPLQQQAAVTGADGLRFAPPGWRACLPMGEGRAVLSHRGTSRDQVYNGPLWNVRVDPAIIPDHTHLWTPAFKALLRTVLGD